MRKRRNLSGVFIFDTLEGDEKREPTCIEDCTPEKRTEWLKTLDKDALIRLAEILCTTIREVGDYFDISR